MLKIDSVLKNPVSLVKVNQGDDIDRYFLDNNCKVLSVTSSDVEMRSKKVKYESEKEFIVTNPKGCCDMMIKNMKDIEADFATVIVLNNINICFDEKMMVILIWTEMFKRTKRRPFLVITTGTYLIPELPFVMDEKNIFMTRHDTEMELIYHGKNYSPNSGKLVDECVAEIEKMHSTIDVPKEGSVWAVFYSGKKKTDTLFLMLKEHLTEDADIQVFKNFKRHKSGKRTIVLVDKLKSSFISDHVDGVFDCMISEEYGDDSEIFYRHSSKQLSELREGVLARKGFCLRMCEMEFYESLPKMESISLRVDKMILESLLYGMNPKDFFQNMVSEEEISMELQKLMSFGLCDLEKITVPGKLALRIPLKYRNSGLLISWMMKEKHLFPCIVAVCLMEVENSLVFFHHKGARKEAISKRYGSHHPFSLYLELFNRFLKESGDLKPKNLVAISKKNGLNFRVLDSLLSKIRFLVDTFSKRKNVEIGLYDTGNLIKKLTPYFEIFYQDSIYKLSDMDKRIYISERDTEAYGIDGCKHFPIDDIPTRIVAFDKSKINDSVDSVQRSRNLIFYFSAI